MAGVAHVSHRQYHPIPGVVFPMLNLNFTRLRSVLCLGAHADDIEIGCGGALLRLLSQHPQLEVQWVIFSGHQGRVAEARASAARYLQGHTHQVTVHAFRDSFFPYQAEAIKEVFHGLSRACQPDVIFTHRRDDAHQDHRVLAELTWCAFRNHVVLEYEIPKYEGDLGNPNVYFSLDRELAERKVRWLYEAFPTQTEKPWFTEDTFWALLRLRGLEANSPGLYAEGFYARKLVF